MMGWRARRARRLRLRIAALEAELGLGNPGAPLRLEVWKAETDEMLRYRMWWRGTELRPAGGWSRYARVTYFSARSMEGVLRHALREKEWRLDDEAEAARLKREAEAFGVKRVTL